MIFDCIVIINYYFQSSISIECHINGNYFNTGKMHRKIDISDCAFDAQSGKSFILVIQIWTFSLYYFRYFSFFEYVCVHILSICFFFHSPFGFFDELSNKLFLKYLLFIDAISFFPPSPRTCFSFHWFEWSIWNEKGAGRFLDILFSYSYRALIQWMQPYVLLHFIHLSERMCVFSNFVLFLLFNELHSSI